MSSRPKKILIADDDENLVSSIATLLQSCGYETLSTGDPKEVLKMAKSEKPDTIILDIMFDGISGPDGFELSRKIADDPQTKNIPVIILSGVKKIISSDFVVEPDKEWMPVAVFIDKPVRPDQLLNEINNLMQKRS
jgi:CheY-like chemotaxis protein